MFSRFDEATHTFLSTHIANPDGSDETELALPGPEGGGRWSHSGKEIAVMDILPDDRVGTAIISPDGTVDRVLEIPDKSLNLVCTVWSPDDARLACEGWDNKDQSRSGIYTVSAADGSELERLTTTPKGVVDIPGDYSPDGTHFVFKRAGDEEAGPLQIANLDDGSLKPLSETGYDDPGRFSPDGTSVLTSDGEQVVVLDLDGEAVRSIEMAGLSLFGPVWSPDGEWIAYSGSGSGPYADIYISRPDGSGSHQVTTTDDNEIVVEWGPG
jgi:TolB protein